MNDCGTALVCYLLVDYTSRAMHGCLCALHRLTTSLIPWRDEQGAMVSVGPVLQISKPVLQAHDLQTYPSDLAPVGTVGFFIPL